LTIPCGLKMGKYMGQDHPVDKNTLALSCPKLRTSLSQLPKDRFR